jgi:hypothetical protein
MKKQSSAPPDKQPVQANPGRAPGGKSPPDGVSSAATQGRDGKNESAGGAYPNPHRGKTPQNKPADFTGHGGQTEMAYHGTGQLGEEEIPGEDNPNAPTKSR